MENHPIGFAHHIREHVQAAAVRHANHDFAHALCATMFDEAFKRRDHRLAAIQTKTLGTDIFAAQEFLVLLSLNYLGENGLFAFRREANRLICTFHPFLEETAFFHIGNVHIF